MALALAPLTSYTCRFLPKRGRMFSTSIPSYDPEGALHAFASRFLSDVDDGRIQIFGAGSLILESLWPRPAATATQ